MDSWVWSLVCTSVSLTHGTSSQDRSPRNGQTRSRVNLTRFCGRVFAPHAHKSSVQLAGSERTADSTRHTTANHAPVTNCRTAIVLLQTIHRLNNYHCAAAKKAATVQFVLQREVCCFTFDKAAVTSSKKLTGKEETNVYSQPSL